MSGGRKKRITQKHNHKYDKQFNRTVARTGKWRGKAIK